MRSSILWDITYYSTLKMEATFSSGKSVTFDGLHDFISQKIDG
jgi:hypothetical protein